MRGERHPDTPGKREGTGARCTVQGGRAEGTDARACLSMGTRLPTLSALGIRKPRLEGQRFSSSARGAPRRKLSTWTWRMQAGSVKPGVPHQHWCQQEHSSQQDRHNTGIKIAQTVDITSEVSGATWLRTDEGPGLGQRGHHCHQGASTSTREQGARALRAEGARTRPGSR